VIDRETLVRYLDDYLETRDTPDYCPNGLQVEGRRQIRKVVTGVSACAELFRSAGRRGADAVIVHHGLFWRGAPLPLVGVHYQRVAELIRGELNLLAYHLPLDRHPEVGNNVVAARRLGLEALEPFGQVKGAAIGCKGHFGRGLRPEAVIETIRSTFRKEPIAFLYGPARISSVGFVSGSAGALLHDAIDQDLDLFITGEAEEWSMSLAKEAGVHFVAAGHHATERFGVQALGDHLRDRFGLAAEFVDIANPI
jgi:dinuclear metal center YbgI/SA1388 family protein